MAELTDEVHRIVCRLRRFMMIQDWSRRSRRLATSLYFLALTWLMLAPGSAFEDVGDVVPHQDKIVHGVLFVALALLVRWSLPAPSTSNGALRRARFGGFAALLLYAGAIEALQPVLGGAGRQFDWLDMACNLAGAVFGWLLYGCAEGTMPPVAEECGRV